jgi:hypothetical protein
MVALSARGHLTPGAVVIRRSEAGGARQQGWALAGSRPRERGWEMRAHTRAPEPGPSAAAARSLVSRFTPGSPSAPSALLARFPRRPSGRRRRAPGSQVSNRGGHRGSRVWMRGVEGERPPVGAGRAGQASAQGPARLAAGLQGACVRGGAGPTPRPTGWLTWRRGESALRPLWKVAQ